MSAVETDTDGGEEAAVAFWRERLEEARVPLGRGLKPSLLADRYDAETPAAIHELTDQACREMVDGGFGVLTLDDLDVAADRLAGPDESAGAGGGVQTDG